MRINSIIMAKGGHNNSIKKIYHGIGEFLGVEAGSVTLFWPLMWEAEPIPRAL
jgi:hypothetical protein